MSISYLTSQAADLDIISMVKFIGLLVLAVALIAGLFRLLFGKRSSLNQALCAAIGIFFIYAATALVYTFDPYALSRFLAPLPFVTFSQTELCIASLAAMKSTALCTEVLSMIILSFLMNLIDSWMPRGKKILGWYLWRLLGVLLAMGAHYLVHWAFNTFLPGVLVTYAPTILLGILITMLLIGLANLLLSVILTVVNPIIGGIYAFFFSNKIGKQLSKAVLTTLILCILVYYLGASGYGAIAIDPGTMGNYIPLVATLLILWYSIGHF